MANLSEPKLNIQGQIEHFKSQGVGFDLMSEGEAAEYLRSHCNYFRLQAYCKNFPKHPGGKHKGEYIYLDFAKLVDLSIIDKRMRYVLLQMALDVEQFAKMKLLRAIEESNEDGYQIVEDYKANLQAGDAENGSHDYSDLMVAIERNRSNPYSGDIVAKYSGYYPVWAFVEIISFGALIDFYSFCATRLKNQTFAKETYLLKTVKGLRIIMAHNDCVIYRLGEKDSKYRTSHLVLRALKGITKASKDYQLDNECLRQITTLLYTHARFVSSYAIHEHTKQLLDSLVTRMFLNIDYYKDNIKVLPSFEFIKKVVDIFF